ncbi:hypothetical protein KIPE111705_01085 [Kibdelosporangium persicum]|uniref:Uncharacterized protein n=1 Tax=Kibdelosporangium persicum TaxID=2698649 RepID=A0ABX2F878_9PSEU|nr:hypothetical protein [Kibdelosporangium persicum]NRN67005.1 hypothetical protein [Kibdelosporangium persicum]
MNAEAQGQLALLCTRLEQDGGPLAEEGPLRALAMSIVERLRAGEDPDAVAESLDDLDDQLMRAGYAGGLGTSRAMDVRVPGLGGHPVLEVLGCPGKLCGRVALPDEDHVCAVFGRPLERVRLRP